MAWIYLAESEGSQKLSKDTSSRSPIVKTIHTAKRSSYLEWLAATYPMHRFGMTLKQLEEIWFRQPRSSTVDFPAKTLASSDAEKVWAVSEAAYFSRSLDSSEKFGQLSFSLKTSLESVPAVGTLSSKNFPTYGMTVAGGFYPLRMWERITAVKGGGYWPTASARDWKDTPGMARGRPDGKTRVDQLARAIYAKMWPTPTVNMVTGGGDHSAPSVRAGRHGINLKGAVGGGSLNPTWVEWLMGYPQEWTVLEDWAMRWFRPRRVKRLKDWRE